ncbi:hypothetical protein HDV02_001118 [Globomyces sp. JEL0801]|nr:hypothetical protein HDV02_001118 [Globomyces sp. JEL0801]
MLTAGTAYAFSLYGPQLSTLFHLSQSETAFVASCGNAGVFIGGPISGTLVDRFPNFAYLFFLVGGLSIFTGYQLVSHTVSGLLPRPHYLVLALYFFIIGLGRNWPASYRSIAVGTSVGFFGLSAFFFATVGSQFFIVNQVLQVEQFLSFLGGFCLIISLLSALLLKPIQTKIEIIVDNVSTESTPFLHATEHESEYVEEREEGETSSITSRGYISTPVDDLEYSICDERIELDDISCFPSINAFLLAYNMFAIIGVGLMYLNNVGAILISLLPTDMDSSHPSVQVMQKSHVQLLSLLSFASRVLIGILSDVCASSIGLPRTFWPITGALLMVIGCGMMLYIKNADLLYVVSVIIGSAYGTIWSAVPILVGEYFGLKNFAKNWGWMTVMPAFGGYLFATIFGAVYEESGVSVCKGQNCYMKSFIIATVLSLLALFGNIFLYFKRYRETRV